MGFFDKARRMADQAQQKLDEAQQRFNDSQRQRAAAARAGEQAPVVQYDSAGRPMEPAPPAPGPAGGYAEPAVEPEAAAPAPVTPPPESTAGPPPAHEPAPPAAPAAPAEPVGGEAAVASQAPADLASEQPTEVTAPATPPEAGDAGAESSAEPADVDEGGDQPPATADDDTAR
jgi:hypothetical protein